MTEHQDDTVRPETDPPANDERAGEPDGAQHDQSADAAPPPSSAPASLPAEPQGVAPDYDKYGVPSLDFVRNKIEGRYATSIGAAELAQQTWEATSAQERAAQREKSAQEALERIRQSLRDDKQS